MISVIVPVYNEKENIKELHSRIVKAMNGHGDIYEIIFVDDGSGDGTLEIMKTLKPLKIVSFQRNYGNTPALDAGIQHAKGDVLAFLDADLQNDPAEIPILLNQLKNGYDVVAGWRKNRKDPLGRRLFSWFANKAVRLILGSPLNDHGCALKVYKSRFIKDFRLWGSAQVFLPAVAKERGARIAEVAVSHSLRKAGSSKIKISKMLRAGLDLLQVKFKLYRHAHNRPLYFIREIIEN